MPLKCSDYIRFHHLFCNEFHIPFKTPSTHLKLTPSCFWPPCHGKDSDYLYNLSPSVRPSASFAPGISSQPYCVSTHHKSLLFQEKSNRTSSALSPSQSYPLYSMMTKLAHNSVSAVYTCFITFQQNLPTFMFYAITLNASMSSTFFIILSAREQKHRK